MSTAVELQEHDDSLVIDNEITVGTIFAYLVGSRAAILKIATNRQSLCLGLMFVISAGFAREYDGEDLWHEPWHLLLPQVASLVTSFLLFVPVYLLALRRGVKFEGFFGSYRTFLSLYWMTAPLAWLYAIPVERFFSPVQAMSFNLNLLGLVSIWRVILIIHVICVIFNAHWKTVFPVVMLFADTVLLVLSTYFPVPILSIMGGIRISERESVIMSATLLSTAAGVLTYPLWTIGTLIVFLNNEPKWVEASRSSDPSVRIRGSVWVLAAVSIIIWSAILPFTQPEQRRRFEVERLMRAGQLKDAVEFMFANRIDEFPPHWDPPPDVLYDKPSRPIAELLKLVADRPDHWARRVFVDKFQRQFGRYRTRSYERNGLWQMTNDDRMTVILALQNMPDRDRILQGDDFRLGLDEPLRMLVSLYPAERDTSECPAVSEEVRDEAQKLLDQMSR